jgi:hypothetical protein
MEYSHLWRSTLGFVVGAGVGQVLEAKVEFGQLLAVRPFRASVGASLGTPDRGRVLDAGSDDS